MRILSVLLMLSLPAQAVALSCERPSVKRSYAQAQAEASSYVVVAGRLGIKGTQGKKAPKFSRLRGKQPAGSIVSATLTGRSLTKKGFTTPFDKPVTLNISCVASWCGSAQNGEEVLAFVRQEGGQYVIDVAPCGGRVFSNPKPAMLKQAQRCMRRGGCS